MTVYKWSQLADNDASIDSTINLVEGMAPSAVNNSCRAMMAAIAKMRDDISGKLITSASGTNVAYVVSSNQGFSSLAAMDGAMLSVRFDKINGAGSPSVQINVDGLGLKPMRISPGVELPINNLVVGVPYGLTYSNSDGAWYFQDGALTAATVLSPILVPIGGVIMWMMNTLPSSSWYWCNGAQVTSPALATGSQYPSSLIVNSTTIITPDYRELVPYGRAQMGGTGARNIAFSNTPNIGNYATLGLSGTTGYIGEAAHALTSGESRYHTHTGAVNNAGFAGTSYAGNHLHSLSAVFAGGGLATLGLAYGNFNGNTDTGNVDTPTNTVGLAGGIADGSFTTAGPRGDESGNPGFGDGAHNTQPPSYPVNFIIRIA